MLQILERNCAQQGFQMQMSAHATATGSQRRWTVNGAPFAVVLWDSLETRLEQGALWPEEVRNNIFLVVQLFPTRNYILK